MVENGLLSEQLFLFHKLIGGSRGFKIISGFGCPKNHEKFNSLSMAIMGILMWRHMMLYYLWNRSINNSYSKHHPFSSTNQQLTYHQYHTCRIPLSPRSYYKTEIYQTNIVRLEYVIMSCGLFAAVRCCAGWSDPIQVSGGAHDRPAPGLRWCPYRRRHSDHWDRSWDADQSTSNVSICPSPASTAPQLCLRPWILPSYPLHPIPFLPSPLPICLS